MEIAVLWRAVLLRIFRVPATWILAAALLALVPFLDRFSPLLVGAGGDLGARRVCDWAFPVALTAILLGQGALEEIEGLTMRLPKNARNATRLGGVLAPIWALQLPLLLGAISTSMEPRSVLPLAGRMLCADLQLAALATLLMAASSGALSRGALFLGIAWLLPAFLAEGGTVMRLVASWVDAGRFLRPEFDFQSPAAWAALGPPIGLFGASLLFRPARI